MSSSLLLALSKKDIGVVSTDEQIDSELELKRVLDQIETVLVIWTTDRC